MRWPCNHWTSLCTTMTTSTRLGLQKQNESPTATAMVPQKANLKQMLPTEENAYTGMADFSLNFSIKIGRFCLLCSTLLTSVILGCFEHFQKSWYWILLKCTWIKSWSPKHFQRSLELIYASGKARTLCLRLEWMKCREAQKCGWVLMAPTLIHADKRISHIQNLSGGYNLNLDNIFV